VSKVIRTTLEDAQAHLPDLIEAAVRGEKVLIATEGKRGDQIVLFVPVAMRRQRKAGSAKGLIEMSEDFDAPLPDSDAYP
jgi:antitoxin (DNA-binding transcriptional repressor) of toxin-antitoxin stability system